jgi:hypothetical protein
MTAYPAYCTLLLHVQEANQNNIEACSGLRVGKRAELHSAAFSERTSQARYATYFLINPYHWALGLLELLPDTKPTVFTLAAGRSPRSPASEA